MEDLTERIVAILRHDGRTPFTSIAAKLGVSRETVTSRFQSLTQTGRMRIVAGIHPHAVGLPVSGHFAIRVQGSSSRVIKNLQEMDSLEFISETTGPFQVAVDTWLPTREAMREQLLVLRALPGVAEVQTHLYDRILTSFFGEHAPSPNAFPHDMFDIRLLNALRQDGRMPFAELAHHMGLSVSGCRSRLRRLIEAGVMKIGAIDLRTGDSEETLMGLGISVSDDAEAITKILEAGTGVEFLAQTFGKYDLLATIVFSSTERFRRFVQQLRAHEAISAVDTWLHTGTVRERYEHRSQTSTASVATPAST